MNDITYTLYKIYYGDHCVYLGRTNQKISDRLRGHFFKTPNMKTLEIRLVTKIEIAECKTKADMYLYEIYYINKIKPAINCDDKANDEITVTLPELDFKVYIPPNSIKWVEKVNEIDKEYKDKKELEHQRFLKKQEARKTLKGDAYYDWLEANGY